LRRERNNMKLTKMTVAGALALVCAGCATVEMSTVGNMAGRDRLLVIQNDGYELLWILPLWSGNLEWNNARNDVDVSPVPFKNHADVNRLYSMARKIAERENCDLVDLKFIDSSRILDLTNFYGALKADDVAISAVLRPKVEEPAKTK